jgi:hypothetical protein
MVITKTENRTLSVEPFGSTSIEVAVERNGIDTDNIFMSIEEFYKIYQYLKSIGMLVEK